MGAACIALDFPIVSAAYGTIHPSPSNFDAFVLKLNSTGCAIVYSTYLGGTYYEYLGGIEAWRPGHRDESAEPPESGRTFWRQQNVVRFARTWGAEVGAPRVVVAVAHQQDHQRLMGLLGITLQFRLDTGFGTAGKLVLPEA